MGAFNLVKNGLALIAGVALLDVILEEFGDSPSPKYSETDSERRYREGVDKMADMRVEEAKEKMEHAQKLAEDKKQQYDELTKQARELLTKISEMAGEKVSDAEVVAEKEITDEKLSEDEERPAMPSWLHTPNIFSDKTDCDETELSDLKNQLEELQKKLEVKAKEISENE